MTVLELVALLAEIPDKTAEVIFFEPTIHGGVAFRPDVVMSKDDPDIKWIYEQAEDIPVAVIKVK